MSRFDAAEDARLAQAQQQDMDVRAILSTEAGRRFFFHLTDERCALLSGSYAGTDTHETAYREGRRSIARELVADAQRVAPQRYLLMLQEAMNARLGADEAAKE